MDGTLREEEMNHVLERETFGHLGCCEGVMPYIFPMAFAYHRNVIYGQTKEGRKIEILRKNPHVCFQVQNLHGNVWRSVLCHGTFEELEFSELTDKDAIKTVGLLSKHLGQIQNAVGVVAGVTLEGTPKALTVDGRTSTLFRIVVTEKTGRFYVGDPGGTLSPHPRKP